MLAAEDTCRAQEREAAEDARRIVRHAREHARAVTEDEIRALELRRAFEREALRELSMNRVELAANVIFERAIAHGDS
jgi:hydroxypyruvate isomerase